MLPTIYKSCEQNQAPKMAAMMMNMITSIPTTTSNSFPSSLSWSSNFNYMVAKNRTSTRIKHVDGFVVLTSSTDKNDVLLSKEEVISSNDVSYMLDSASDVVRSFYDGINSRDLSRVVELIAEDCVYEDLVFPQPFVGRKAILDFFEKFIYTISQDLQFAIDDISGEDTSAVGVTWHLEWKGKPFPFSKGCSFYRLKVVDGQRKIIYARDVVEPAAKPGDFALAAIRGVTWLLERFPQLADRF